MQSTINITLPEDQLEGTVAKISRWLIDVGSTVTAGDPILELETDKVMMEVCAPASGQLQVINKFPGDDVELETVVGKLALMESSVIEAGPSANSPQEMPKTVDARDVNAGAANTHSINSKPVNNNDQEHSKRHLVGPAVRRLQREFDLDLSEIPGSGKGGRVTRNDVIAYLDTARKNSNPVKPAAAKGELVGTEVSHTPMRKAIAKHMVDSLLNTSPHVTSVFEMDMSNIIEHRRWHKKEFADADINLTFTAYFLAATVKAMQAVPQMNARYHEHALELFEDINIGVGTALGDKGLVVPVVQQVQSKTLFDIAKALQVQTEKARKGELMPADMKNGTFTISNHGVSGSLLAAPIIINQPQVAILGIGKLEKRVVVREVNGCDEIQIKPLCYVSLSIDHRAVDAYQTNQFLSVFVETIEQWGQ